MNASCVVKHIERELAEEEVEKKHLSQQTGATGHDETDSAMLVYG